MKKIFVFLFALMMALSSCHKTNNHIHETTYVTFTPQVDRATVNEFGQVTFNSDDVLYAYASGISGTPGRYLGTLNNVSGGTGSTASFAGTIGSWYQGEFLSFYYLGDNTVNTTGTTEINYVDQTGTNTYTADLNAISRKYLIGLYRTQAPDDAVTVDFAGTVANMIIIAALDTHEFGSEYVRITSPQRLNNLVKINIDGSIEYCVAGAGSSASTGHIMIGPGNTKKYIALLPKSAAYDTEANVWLNFTSNDKTGNLGQYIRLAQNDFIHAAGPDNETIYPVEIHATDCESSHYINFPTPESCMSSPFLFTTAKENHNGVMVTKKVVFSQGNLVYDQGRFKQHKNAWDFCPISSNSDINANGTFDVFGWATSGYSFGQHFYEPYSNAYSEYGGSVGYGYGSPTSGYKQSFYPDKTYRRSDWGWYQFGMNYYPEYTMEGGKSYWRSLGQAEWTYIFYSRAVSSTGLTDYATSTNITNGRFAKCTLCGVKGVLLFPDTYSHPASIHLSYINTDGTDGYTTNILSESDYNTLHAAGVEFIGINGYWDKSTETFIDPTLGYYWSCKTQKTDQAIICKMTDKASGSIYTTHVNKYQGLYVRLVFQVSGEIY